MPKDDTRKSTPTGVAIGAAVIIFVICAATSVALSAYHRQAIDRLITYWQSWVHPKAAKPIAIQKIAKSQRVDKAVRPSAALLKPGIVFDDADFSLAERFTRTDFCAVMQPALPGLKLGWRENSLFSDSADCSGELNNIARPDAQLHNSLFMQTTRNMLGATTMFRLKLIYLPDLDERVFRDEFAKAAEVSLRELFGSDADSIVTDVKALEPFQTQLRGVNVRLFKEQLVSGAFNFMIETRCGKFQCQAASPYYRLNMPARQVQAEPQQQ